MVFPSPLGLSTCMVQRLAYEVEEYIYRLRNMGVDVVPTDGIIGYGSL